MRHVRLCAACMLMVAAVGWLPSTSPAKSVSHSRAHKPTWQPVARLRPGAHSSTARTSSDPFLLGNQSVAGHADRFGGGTAGAFSFIDKVSGSTTAITVYLDSLNGASKLIAGLYSDQNGHPGTRLTAGSLSSPRAGAWDMVPVGATSVSAGTHYWIVVLGTGGSLHIRDASGGSCASQTSRQTGLTWMPSEWTSGTTRNGCTMSSYVSGTETPAVLGATTPLPPIPLVPPVNLVAPAVSGTTTDGQTLTTSDGTWLNSPGSYGYGWQDCDSSGNGCTTISGATGSSYTLASADVGHTVRSVVMASNDGGSASASSSQTAVVSAPPAPANTAAPVVSGTATQGQSLSTSNGSWSGSPASFSYGWQDCDSSGNGCTTISGATGSSYTLASADVGHTVRSVVMASNDGGSASASSSQTAVVSAPPAPANTAAPVVSGTATQGQSLSTSNGSWSGSPASFSYGWQDCDSSGNGCTTISGATGSSYTLASADVGHTVRSVVTASNGSGSASKSSAPTAVVAASGGGGGGGTSCSLNATTSTFASQVSAASAGQTICLASGSYGTWSGTNKAITIAAASGATPTMRISFASGDSSFTLDGISGMGGTISAGAKNITIQNSTFVEELDIEGAVTNIVVNHNDFTYPVQSTASGPNAKIFLATSGASPGAAVTIENNDIENGDLDGVHFGGGSGDLILSNRFQNLCDRGVNHTDNIQFQGGSQIRIAGNYVYEAQNCPTQGITSYDGGTNGVIIEDNVVDVPRDWGIEFYSDQNSIIRHNTVVYHDKSYSEFNTGDGQIDIDRKSQDPAGSGTHVYDNIAKVGFTNGSTGTADHNTDPSTVSYVGGAPGPASVYSGLFLTASSPGRVAADDGTDTGIQHSVS